MKTSSRGRLRVKQLCCNYCEEVRNEEEAENQNKLLNCTILDIFCILPGEVRNHGCRPHWFVLRCFSDCRRNNWFCKSRKYHIPCCRTSLWFVGCIGRIPKQYVDFIRHFRDVSGGHGNTISELL